MRRARDDETAGFRRFCRASTITEISSTGDGESRVRHGAPHLALAFESCQNRRLILGDNTAKADSARYFRLVF
jgi:hypothetical protein